MFQAMILMVHGVTFIFRVTESNMLTSSTDVQLNTKYSDTFHLNIYFSKKKNSLIQTFDTFKINKVVWEPKSGHKEWYRNSYPVACWNKFCFFLHEQFLTALNIIILGVFVVECRVSKSILSLVFLSAKPQHDLATFRVNSFIKLCQITCRIFSLTAWF